VESLAGPSSTSSDQYLPLYLGRYVGGCWHLRGIHGRSPIRVVWWLIIPECLLVAPVDIC